MKYFYAFLCLILAISTFAVAQPQRQQQRKVMNMADLPSLSKYDASQLKNAKVLDLNKLKQRNQRSNGGQKKVQKGRRSLRQPGQKQGMGSMINKPAIVKPMAMQQQKQVKRG